MLGKLRKQSLRSPVTLTDSLYEEESVNISQMEVKQL
jgi:hypothetical protein